MIGFNYTETEKYQVPRTTFIIAVACGSAGMIVFTVLFTYICTKFQYWVSPPTEHIRKMEEYRQKDIEFKKQVILQKKTEYSKSEWNRDTPYKNNNKTNSNSKLSKSNKHNVNDTYEDDEMQATSEFRNKNNTNGGSGGGNKKFSINKKANGPRR